MEKTIIINIGNTIIHIEESAYELLKGYLSDVKQHFVNHDDDLEIVTDIENRIAELLIEQLEKEKKQVINTENVNLVMAQMGRVEDFESLDEEIEDPIIDNNEQYSTKKLYRDIDERVIAGVCSGIAHYFKIDAKWIRLAAILTIFLGGSSILIYIFLWIIMPKAKSRLEKMEMKGEPVNLKGFQKSLNEELLAVKERLSEVNKEAQPIINRLGIFIAEFFEWLAHFISGSGKVILKVIAGSIIIFGILLLLTMIIGIAAFQGFWDSSVYAHFPFSMINEGNRNVILISVFTVFFIPLLTLVLFSIRVAFNKKAISRKISFVLLIIWLTGLATTGYHAAKISSEFKQHAELTQTTELNSFSTYLIDIDNSKYFSKADSLAYGINSNQKSRIVVDDLDDEIFISTDHVRININKSETGAARIVQKYESQGKTFRDALQNAQNISYTYQLKDSTILFNPRFQLNRGAIWRNQEVNLNLEIPTGTKLILKRDLNSYINNYWTWDCNNQDHNSIWIMTEEGLKCKYDLDHPEKNSDGNN